MGWRVMRHDGKGNPGVGWRLVFEAETEEAAKARYKTERKQLLYGQGIALRRPDERTEWIEWELKK